MDAIADNKKKVGYVLFIIGMILIAYVIGSIIFVFVGAGSVPLEIFEVESNDQISFEMPSYSGNNTNMSVENTMNDMYPMFNLMIWLSLAFLLLFAGYFLCKLGLTAMSSPVSTKPKIKKVFSEKKYISSQEEAVNSNDYSQIDNDEFEKKII